MPHNMNGMRLALGVMFACAICGQQAVFAAAETGTLPPPAANGAGKDGWWISETVAGSPKNQPVFFGVRLANAPQAALSETYSPFLTAGDKMAVRLWGCNDLPKEFNGRARVALKQGGKQFATEEETVRLAPETAKCLAKYNFVTENLAAGQYTLETSLFDNAGELVQQHVATVTIRLDQKKEEARRSAIVKAEAAAAATAAVMARKDAERKAASDAKLAAQAKKAAELKARDDARKQAEAAALAAKARKDAEAKARAEAAAQARAKKDAEDKVARDAKVKSRIAAIAVVPAADQSSPVAPTSPASSSAVAKGGAADQQAVEKSKDLEKNKWRVAAGMFARRIGAQRFRTGSYSAGYAIANKSSRDSSAGTVGSGNAVEYRTYDDGYLGPDDFTGLDGGTWNWGYNSGQQVNGNKIEMSGVSASWRDFSRQTTASEAENSDSTDTRGALMLEADRYFVQTRYVDCGLSLGLSRAQTFEASASGINNFNDSQAWAAYNGRIVDSYDITGKGITPESAPYKGNVTGPGPVIDAIPVNRQHLGDELVSEGSYRAYNSISESLDMDLSTLSLGLSVKGNYLRLYVIGATGPTLNMVEKDASYTETLYASNNGGAPQVLQYWSDSSSGTECLFGYYVQAEVGVRVYRGLHLGIFGRYDWLESVSGNVGPSRYEVNPAGGSLGGAVGLEF